jgi:hypothetical protein
MSLGPSEIDLEDTPGASRRFMATLLRSPLITRKA